MPMIKKKQILIAAFTTIFLTPISTMAEQNVHSKIESMLDDLSIKEHTLSELQVQIFEKTNELAEEVGRRNLYQGLHLHMAEMSHKDKDWDWGGAAWAIRYVSILLPDDDKIRAIMPLLSDKRDYVRDGAIDVIEVVEKGGVRFAEVGRYLRKKGPENVPPLVYKELYQFDPGRALQTLLIQVYDLDRNRSRSLKWNLHLVDTARFRLSFSGDRDIADAVRDGAQALREMAEDEEWWVRLYVAHQANDRYLDDLLDDETVRKLRNDPNTLVADVASR